MSTLTAQPTAPSRALAVLALVGLGGWAALTLVIGVADIVNRVRTVSFLTGPPEIVTGTDLLQGDGAFALSVSLFVFWILSLNVVLIATVLGVLDLVVIRRSWRRTVAFAVVAVAGPAAALVVSQVANGQPDYANTSYLRAVVPGFALVVIALVTILVAWRALFGSRSDDPS